ncbi:hypothetical protein HY450_04005 [Candidatus Pacearchaeota archaeon]|nr:hypothetical protein [Candidatus Pacearchaeota archaeon]
MEVLLDTNFIISCIIKKIDYMNQLEEEGFRIKVPREVLQEMKGLLKENKTSHKEREAINLALEVLNSKKIKKMKLGGKNVDDGLIKRGREGFYIATLDREIKNKIKNKVVISSAKRMICVVRD